MKHTCHAPGCKRVVPPHYFACSRHWYMLPRRLRNRIWHTYRPGQENDKQPSIEYIDAAYEAVRWLHAQAKG